MKTRTVLFNLSVFFLSIMFFSSCGVVDAITGDSDEFDGCSGSTRFGNNGFECGKDAILSVKYPEEDDDTAVTEHDFGSILLSTAYSKTLALYNGGAHNATSIAAQDFTEGSVFSFKGGTFPGTGGDCTDTLSAGDSCSFVVSINTENTAAYEEDLKIDYNNGSNSATSELTLKASSLA